MGDECMWVAAFIIAAIVVTTMFKDLDRYG